MSAPYEPMVENKKPGKYQGWWLKTNMKAVDQLEKENEKYLKQIEKFLKPTIKYWRKKEWKIAKVLPDYFLEIETSRHTTTYKKTIIHYKELVKYDGFERKFYYYTDDYDLILETVIKIVEDKLVKLKRENCKLYYLLGKCKRLFWE